MTKPIKVIVAILVVVVAAYFSLGLFVIQPLEAIRDGVTFVYFRPGTGLPFLASPDGISLDRTGGVSLLSRIEAITAVMAATENRIIARLPYIEQLYLITTDGAQFEQ